MRLYIRTSPNSGKIYLPKIATDRASLAKLMGGIEFIFNGEKYSVYDVFAEPDTTDSTAVGGLLGGLIGAAGGPLGIVAGSFLGAIIGGDQFKKDRRDVENFNNSKVQQRRQDAVKSEDKIPSDEGVA